MAGRYNVDLDPLVRGDTVLISETVEGAPDLSNKYLTITFKLDPSLPDSEAHLQKTVQLTSLAASSGIANITLLPTDTYDLLPVNYYFDMQVAGSATDVVTIRTGRVRVIADVTRDPVFSVDPPDTTGLVIVGSYSFSNFAVV